jgi:hypothetical protein
VERLQQAERDRRHAANHAVAVPTI